MLFWRKKSIYKFVIHRIYRYADIPYFWSIIRRMLRWKENTVFFSKVFAFLRHSIFKYQRYCIATANDDAAIIFYARVFLCDLI